MHKTHEIRRAETMFRRNLILDASVWILPAYNSYFLSKTFYFIHLYVDKYHHDLIGMSRCTVIIVIKSVWIKSCVKSNENWKFLFRIELIFWILIFCHVTHHGKFKRDHRSNQVPGKIPKKEEKNQWKRSNAIMHLGSHLSKLPKRETGVQFSCQFDTLIYRIQCWIKYIVLCWFPRW